ncbi:unnamed protein product [Prunus brigantina]
MMVLLNVSVLRISSFLKAMMVAWISLIKSLPCQRVGHNKEYCPFANPVHKDNETDMDMTGDIEEEMCSHQVEKLSKMTLDGSQQGPIDPTGDKAGFGIWNVVPTRKFWKKNFKNGTTASEDKGY